MITTIIMTDPALLLLTWLSPQYPVGAFSLSHALEQAVENGDVSDAPTLERWIAACLRHGAGRNDAIVAAASWRACDDAARDALCRIARAHQPGAERLLEGTATGAAFCSVGDAVWPRPGASGRRWCYPVAIGAWSSAYGVPLLPMLRATVSAWVAMLAGAGLRLGIAGQTAGQAILARLMPLVTTTATEAAPGDLALLGGAVFRADIASLRHETQTTRLFRT